MAVTKRTRYEVLKRDNHACRYCGGTAPDVVLTVDHVTPTALGGTDKPDNLVAACRDCNAGKSSTSPDAALVADVRQDALRHAAMVQEAYKVLVERIGERDDYIDEFAEAWANKPVPDNWRDSIGRWFKMGVPIELVTDAAEIARSLPRTFYGTDRFSYMCGIVWKQVRAVGEMADEYHAIRGSFMSEDALIDKGAADWHSGYNRGYIQADKDAARYDPLSIVIDRIQYPEPVGWGT